MIKRIMLIGFIGFSLHSANLLAYDARGLLNDMAVRLASAKQFSVTINMSYDIVQESGQQIQFSEVRKVHLKRPNLLRIDATHSDGEVDGLVYDGNALTKFNVTENVYSVINRKGDVDSIIRYVVSELGVKVPLARMLVTTLPREIQKISTSVDYVETNLLGRQPVAHIAARTRDVDYQLWIGKDRLPIRAVLTYKNEPGQPQFQADFSDWDLRSKIPNAMFRVIPPRSAERIPTLVSANRLGDNRGDQ